MKRSAGNQSASSSGSRPASSPSAPPTGSVPAEAEAPGPTPPAAGWAADRLDTRLRQGRLDAAQLRALAAALAQPAAGQDAKPVGRRAATAGTVAARIADRVRQAGARLAGAAPGLAACAEDATDRLLGAIAERTPWLAGRTPAPLHGALAPSCIHIDPAGRVDLGPPRAEAAFGDPVEDVAQLSAAFVAAGRPDWAERLLAAWADARADFAALPLAALFEGAALLEGAHGYVSAESTRPGARGTALCEARKLLRAARTRLEPPARPWVLAIGGGMASGKSTLASRLAFLQTTAVVSADRARAWLAPKCAGGLPDDAAVYTELLRRAEAVLAARRPVIADACFPRADERAGLRALAIRHGVPFLFVECRAEAAVVRRRLVARARAEGVPASDWLALHDRLRAVWEPVRELPRHERLQIDGDVELDALVDEVRRGLALRVGIAAPGSAGIAPHRVEPFPRGASLWQS